MNDVNIGKLLDTKQIEGKLFDFVERYGGFAPGKYRQRMYVQVYDTERGMPIAAGKSITDAEKDLLKSLRRRRK